MKSPIFSSSASMHKHLTADNQFYSEMKGLSTGELLEVWAHSEEAMYAMAENHINANIPDLYNYMSVWELQHRAYTSKRKIKLVLKNGRRTKKSATQKIRPNELDFIDLFDIL